MTCQLRDMTATQTAKLDSILSRFCYNPANLYGPRFKSERRDLLEVLTGKRPLAKDCGINIMLATLYAMIPLAVHTCQAHRESLLTFALAKLCNPAAHAKMVTLKNAKLVAEIASAEKDGCSVAYLAFLKNKLQA